MLELITGTGIGTGMGTGLGTGIGTGTGLGIGAAVVVTLSGLSVKTGTALRRLLTTIGGRVGIAL
jgi:hypothetical protein